MPHDKPAQTAVPIHELLARRWSPRAIQPEAPVSCAELVALLEAARWAPSCFGAEPWRYVVCDRGEDAAAWQRALSCLNDNNRRWARHAPVLLLAVAASGFRGSDKPNRWGQYDTGAATENLCLQAAALDLVAHQMGGFDAEAARAAFGIPDTFVPMAMVAVGRPGDADRLPEDLQTRETAPRQRSPLAEIARSGHWQNGFTNRGE